ncbi:glycosyltransferase family 39 protein [Thalassoglobus polymorphus]|uniref:Glycosyltransferase RgtA/B/C/D-like domain-containing protein n=1 Tax=Thalassoglobus polymorphus TaxID=2527994 RepID=A0A517QSD6_9PLAN|nr:glycosyltransferase family 39 protein [Thalassoglobus polymorphus]QDT34521.1 hypothetical protein Mal48_37830 [Thalassoglobus polymorphus]
MIAFALRASAPDHLSIEHFDEGVYASNYFSSHLDFRYPDRHLYAPPLFPAILEWALIFSGGNPQAVMFVNVILGTALVAAIWWLTKLIAGDAAAIAAASLATFSDFLIQYSRAALTDTPVCLFMVLAVGCGLLALRDRHTLAILGAALFTAAAWWTKYNGWLPLAILGAGLAGSVVFDRPKTSEWMPRAGTFLVIALGAFLFWLPCLWSLQEYGGYSAVAQNHAGYIVGFGGWWDSWTRHFSVQSFNSKLLIVGGVCAILLFQRTRNANPMQWSNRFWVVLFSSVIILGLGQPILFALLLAGYGLFAGLRKQMEVDRLGFWLIAAWIGGLLLTTPLYRPYPRLFMPLWIGLIIASALGLQALLSHNENAAVVANKKRLGLRSGILGLCLIFLFRSGIGESTFEDRTQLASISKSIVAEIQHFVGTTKQTDDIDAIIYVIGEPGLYYHLASDDGDRFNFITQPGSNLVMLTPIPNAPKIPTFLVLGPHAPDEQQELKAETDRATLIEEFPYQASDLVLLDDFPPSELEKNREQKIQLWKLIED